MYHEVPLVLPLGSPHVYVVRLLQTLVTRVTAEKSLVSGSCQDFLHRPKKLPEYLAIPRTLVNLPLEGHGPHLSTPLGATFQPQDRDRSRFLVVWKYLP